jgi:8-oxo-dGTP pyrophosphatase MutT (NUDIX family)
MVHDTAGALNSWEWVDHGIVYVQVHADHLKSDRFQTMNLKARILDRLQGSQPSHDVSLACLGGITPESAHLVERLTPEQARRAAVLVPLVDRAEGLQVLLTQRAAHLKHHAGQISFPGGRMEPHETQPDQAAFRETEEEIGLQREHIQVLGYLESHLVFTGFHVVPVVGLVQPNFELQPDPSEVAEVFEVPLVSILDTRNHSTRPRGVSGGVIQIYEIGCDNRMIWGATAGILMSLYRLLNR